MKNRGHSQFVFELKEYKAKIKGILSKSYCCYGTLLCHKIDSNMFTDNWVVFWYRDVRWHQPSGYDDPAKSMSWNCAGGARFSKLPIITGPVELFCFHSRWGFQKVFVNCTVKLSVKETKWNLLEVRTHPTFLETLI